MIPGEKMEEMNTKKDDGDGNDEGNDVSKIYYNHGDNENVQLKQLLEHQMETTVGWR
jgi:hypothetical protein